MKFITDNWGLKLLALVLAIAIYYALKNDGEEPRNNHDRRIFQTNS